jgi:hypothetical protein
MESYNPNKQYNVSTLLIGNDGETVISPAPADGRIAFTTQVDIPHYKEAESVMSEQYGIPVATQRYLGHTAEDALMYTAMPHLGAIKEDLDITQHPLKELLDQASNDVNDLHPDDAEILRRFNERRQA